MEAIRDKLRDEHHALIKSTPFQHLIEAFLHRKVTIEQCTKSDDMILELLYQYNRLERKLCIGSKYLIISPNEVSMILGIKNGNVALQVSYGSRNTTSAFMLRRFPNADKISSTMLYNNIISTLQNTGKKDVEDVIRMICLYLCCTYLFAISGTKISWALVNSMEDFENMSHYAWADAIYSTLTLSMDKNYHQPKKITGCAILLLDDEEEKNKNALHNFPRFTKWNLKKLKKVMSKTTLIHLTPEQVIDRFGEIKMKQQDEYMRQASSMSQQNAEHYMIMPSLAWTYIKEGKENIIGEQVDKRLKKAIKDLCNYIMFSMNTSGGANL